MVNIRITTSSPLNTYDICKKYNIKLIKTKNLYCFLSFYQIRITY